ncbi:hypothetical protein [Rubrivivax gelatinosus]|uniref:hypothetical protein n=1 Tax=Rubrivivax gelatinosus TaxID=28068 RepID=UPI001F5B12A2|nr:hypothetical protein [Rubrivivax gelatinosus]
MALAACGGGRSASETREQANITITQTVQASSPAGEAVTFTVVVLNSAQVASKAFTLAWALSGAETGDPTVTCTTASSAVCPTTLAATSTIDSLPAQRQLIFKYTVTIPAATRGAVVATAVATNPDEADSSDNSASATTTAVSADTATYQVYAADGRGYEMVVDFDAGSYTMTGTGVTDSRTFTLDADSGNYLVGSGSERLRTADGIVVGSHAFNGTLTPYIAARSFLTSTTGAAGNYNLMFRRVASDGSGATTHPATARVSGNTLQICENDNEVLYATSCGSGYLKSYTLTVSDGVFTAVATTAGAPGFVFRIAYAGESKVLLSVGASTLADSRLQWLAGLQDGQASFISGSYQGTGLLSGSTDWVAITLDSDAGTYTVNSTSLTDQGVLSSSATQQPNAFFYTELTTQYVGSPVWVLQNYPLLIVGGAPLVSGSVTNLSGLLQIALP